MKRWKGLKIQGSDDQEGKDNSVLVVGLYNRDPCNPVANFFTIDLPFGRTQDMRAYTLIPSCNAPIPLVRRSYCNVHTQVKYHHIYALSISTGKNQSTGARGALYIPTYEYNYKVITRCGTILQEYYITDKSKCENTKRCTSMNSTNRGSRDSRRCREPTRGSKDGTGATAGLSAPQK